MLDSLIIQSSNKTGARSLSFSINLFLGFCGEIKLEVTPQPSHLDRAISVHINSFNIHEFMNTVFSELTAKA